MRYREAINVGRSGPRGYGSTDPTAQRHLAADISAGSSVGQRAPSFVGTRGSPSAGSVQPPSASGTPPGCVRRWPDRPPPSSSSVGCVWWSCRVSRSPSSFSAVLSTSASPASRTWACSPPAASRPWREPWDDAASSYHRRHRRQARTTRWLSGWSSTYGPPSDGVRRIYDTRPVAWGAAPPAEASGG